MMVFFWWRSPVEDTVVRTRLLQSTQEHARSRTLDDHKSGPFLSDAWVGRRLAGAQAGASVVSKSVYRPGYATRKAVMLMRHGVRVRVGGWGQAGSVICASSCVHLRSYSNGNGRHQPCPDSPPLPSAACSRAAAARRLGSARARLPRRETSPRPGMAPVTDGTGTSATGPSQRRAFEGSASGRASLLLVRSVQRRVTQNRSARSPRRPTGHEEDNRNFRCVCDVNTLVYSSFRVVRRRCFAPERNYSRVVRRRVTVLVGISFI